VELAVEAPPPQARSRAAKPPAMRAAERRVRRVRGIDAPEKGSGHGARTRRFFSYRYLFFLRTIQDGTLDSIQPVKAR
jgi:hypothetical protein